eukprot:1226428-Rhodomonas_salina.1
MCIRDRLSASHSLLQLSSASGPQFRKRQDTLCVSSTFKSNRAPSKRVHRTCAAIMSMAFPGTDKPNFSFWNCVVEASGSLPAAWYLLLPLGSRAFAHPYAARSARRRGAVLLENATGWRRGTSETVLSPVPVRTD